MEHNTHDVNIAVVVVAIKISLHDSRVQNLVDQPWIDEEVLEKKVLPYLKENSQEIDSAG